MTSREQQDVTCEESASPKRYPKASIFVRKDLIPSQCETASSPPSTPSLSPEATPTSTPSSPVTRRPEATSMSVVPDASNLQDDKVVPKRKPSAQRGSQDSGSTTESGQISGEEQTIELSIPTIPNRKRSSSRDKRRYPRGPPAMVPYYNRRKWRSRSPGRRRSRSPTHRRSRSPDHHRSRSPGHNRSRSPDHHRSLSPGHHRSRSPGHNRSRSPSYPHAKANYYSRCYRDRSRSPGHGSRIPIDYERSKSPTHYRLRRSRSPSYAPNRSRSPRGFSSKTRRVDNTEFIAGLYKIAKGEFPPNALNLNVIPSHSSAPASNTAMSTMVLLPSTIMSYNAPTYSPMPMPRPEEPGLPVATPSVIVGRDNEQSTSRYGNMSEVSQKTPLSPSPSPQSPRRRSEADDNSLAEARIQKENFLPKLQFSLNLALPKPVKTVVVPKIEIDHDLKNLSEVLIPNELDVLEDKPVTACTISNTVIVKNLNREVDHAGMHGHLFKLGKGIWDSYKDFCFEEDTQAAAATKDAKIQFSCKASALAFYRKSAARFLHPDLNIKFEKEEEPNIEPTFCFITLTFTRD